MSNSASTVPPSLDLPSPTVPLVAGDAAPPEPSSQPGQAEAVVAVRQLVVRYGPKTVLDGVDMTVGRGEIRVILGGSGCGKSTLLKGVLGLTPVTSGTVTVLGQELTRMHEADRRPLFKRLGMLFQAGALFGSLSVAENIALPLREFTPLPPSLVQELVRMKLNLVGMGQTEHLYPAQLSGGMRKRVALARAMILDPEVLFCDEPSAGLDPLTSAELDALILKLKQMFNMTVVVVTHELASIEAIADSILMLGGGKVIAEGPVQEVKTLGIQAVDDFFSRTLEKGSSRDATAAALFGLSPTPDAHSTTGG